MRVKVLVVIPARYSSKRFPGKILHPIMGRPMILHVLDKAKKARIPDRIIVATDDERIREVVEGAGFEVMMTSPDHPSGTDRVGEVVLKVDSEIVVNLQGDEPLIDPSCIDAVVEPLLKKPHILTATLKKKIEKKEDIINPNVIKVVTTKSGYALYFSRSPIPYLDERQPFPDQPIYYKHIGIYSYRREFLIAMCFMKPSVLEERERLEQLRILENGFSIYVVETECETYGVDTIEDVKKVEDILIKKARY